MHKLDKYYILGENGNWMHRPPLKRIMNTILRKLQLFWTDRPYLMSSETVFKNGSPKFLGYKFERVKYYD